VCHCRGNVSKCGWKLLKMHSCVWGDSFMCVTWNSYVWRDAFMHSFIEWYIHDEWIMYIHDSCCWNNFVQECVCVYVCAHRICMCVYAYIEMCVCVCMYMRICGMCICIYVYTYTHGHIYTHNAYECVCARMNAYVCTCIYVGDSGCTPR